MADTDTERVSMLWPQDLKARVQALVGKRGLTDFVVGLVEAEIGRRESEHAVGAAPIAERPEFDGPSEIGTAVGRHVLIAVEKMHPDASVESFSVVKLHCLCGQAFSGAGADDKGMTKARGLFDAHGDEPLRAGAIGAAAWFTDDPTFATPDDDRLQELRDLHELAGSVRVTVTDPDENVTRIVGPPTVVSTNVPMGEGTPLDPEVEPLAHSAQITQGILDGRVIDAKERFGLQSASELPVPPKPNLDAGIIPGDRVIPGGDLEFEQSPPDEPEEPTSLASGACPTCFSPTIDGVCWTCAI